MIDLPTFALSAVMSVPIAVLVSGLGAPTRPPVATEPGVRPAAGGWQLSIVRQGRVLVLERYADRRPCVEDAEAYVAAIRSENARNGGSAGPTRIACAPVGTDRRA